MIKRILKSLSYKLKGISNEQLSLQANIRAGMKVGKNVSGIEGATIDHGHCWLIEIGDNVVFAPQVYLLAHDTSTKRSTGYTRIGKIKIGENCFIGARAFIMPNVELGANTIVGANSLVSKSFPGNVVIAGNPARIVSTVQEYQSKIKKQIEISAKFDESYTLCGGISLAKKKEMILKVSQNLGFVR